MLFYVLSALVFVTKEISVRHGECPDADATKTFIRICQQFIAQNPFEIIGLYFFLSA